MGKTTLTAPPGFNKLTVPQKIDYVQFLWNSIAADEGSVPVPEWHRKVLADRLAGRSKVRGRAKSWRETRREVEAAIRRHRR